MEDIKKEKIDGFTLERRARDCGPCEPLSYSLFLTHLLLLLTPTSFPRPHKILVCPPCTLAMAKGRTEQRNVHFGRIYKWGCAILEGFVRSWSTFILNITNIWK